MICKSLEFDEAVSVFLSMPAWLQLPTLHPDYVRCDSIRSDALTPVYWCAEDKENRLLFSFHLWHDDALGISDIETSYGYGGPISNSQDPDFKERVKYGFGAWARDSGVLTEFLRLHPLVNHEQWYWGSTAHNRSTVVMNLEKDLFGQYQSRRRNDIRKGISEGIQSERVTSEYMCNVFPSMYAENMTRINAEEFYQFGLPYMESLLNSDLADSWIASQNDTPVAAAIILRSDAAGAIEYHLSARSPDGEKCNSTVTLIHQIAQHYQGESFRQFYLGGGRSGRDDDSLLYFKAGFSEELMPFKIGFHIFDSARYETLRLQFPSSVASGRIQFYKGR